jgi:FemAB-related protein (PEP-CTERM system-associated)
MNLRIVTGAELNARIPAWTELVAARGPDAAPTPLSKHPAWQRVLHRGLGHAPYAVEAMHAGRTIGYLPLALVQSLLFGRYLVSLPYLNYGGPIADNSDVAVALVERAVELADRLRVRRLELRAEASLPLPCLTDANVRKAHLRLPLASSVDGLWKQIPSKVRNQIRKGQRGGFRVSWGGLDQLSAFYEVFSRNMRDLGTPAFGRLLFHAILKEFGPAAELCVVRADNRPVAGALLLHGWGMAEVPSASALREFAPTCVNMLLYHHLLERAVARGHAVFDFGRSTIDSNTYRFKTQWGAVPHAAAWQHYLRHGNAVAARPDNPRYQRLIHWWKRLPVAVTRVLGPRIVRGIP